MFDTLYDAIHTLVLATVFVFVFLLIGACAGLAVTGCAVLLSNVL